jgi:threonine-phosphate decarboxylase
MIPQLHGGNIHTIKALSGSDCKEILDFSVSINPLGPPEGLWEYLRAEFESILSYPEISANSFKTGLSAYHNLPSEDFIAGNGSVDLLFSLISLLPGKRALIPFPTFIEYERACAIHGWQITHLPPKTTRDFDLDLAGLLEALTAHSVLFLCMPNNPTGQTLPVEVTEKIIHTAGKKGTFVVLDEAFLPFTDIPSAISLVPAHKNLIILRSMTKSYAIPGLRLGYAVASPEIIADWGKFLPPWNVNALAQMAGLYCLEKGKKYLTASVQYVRKESAWLAREIAKMPPLLPLPTEANYLLVSVGGGAWTADDLFMSLAHRGIAIRHCGSFRGMGNRYVRIGLRKREDNLKLLAALRTVDLKNAPARSRS